MVTTADNPNKNELTIRTSTDGFSYVLFDNDKHTFVPAAVYNDNNKKQYLEILGLADGKTVAMADYIGNADAYNVYAVTKDEYDALRRLPDSIEARHASSVLVEKLIDINAPRTDDTRIYLNIKDQSFEMTVLRGAALLFDNTFRFKTKEDFLYFLLFAMEQLHLDVETVEVCFLGLIEETSQIVELTSRYVRNVRFKKDIKCEL